jgi:hypothetical protein
LSRIEQSTAGILTGEEYPGCFAKECEVIDFERIVGGIMRIRLAEVEKELAGWKRFGETVEMYGKAIRPTYCTEPIRGAPDLFPH